jgi:hypothetical protein
LVRAVRLLGVAILALRIVAGLTASMGCVLSALRRIVLAATALTALLTLLLDGFTQGL